MSRLKRVLLLIESSRAYGRGCLAGVAAYVRAHRHWRVLHVERSLNEALPSFLARGQADGVIARIETPRLADAIDRLGLPTVDLLGTHRPRGGGMLDTDSRQCARLAADHFLSRGFRHMGYCGYPGISFSDERGRHFAEYLASLGHETFVFDHAVKERAGDHIIARERGGELSERNVAPWLRSLPKPAAVFACNDIRGRQVLASCERAGLNVPDDVAVLGVDNDEVICDLSIPPLSSIEPDTRRLGYEGAAMLDRLMAGELPPDGVILIPPRAVRVRPSTDVLAVDDRETAAALRYVRNHACEGITVGVVARRLALSRTTLDRRFRRLLGRGVKAEIDRIRVQRAKQLLDETDYKISVVAEMAGYGLAPQFVTAFKRLVGCTPGAYRARGVR
ncbi:MAG TPA: XylR family transcriptional regulator [Planctomycetaceae bacterium]|nr:XylR family transcriptional regulator [Planctomycetaceae bacterium]